MRKHLDRYFLRVPGGGTAKTEKVAPPAVAVAAMLAISKEQARLEALMKPFNS